jgi:hypothetical protein
MESAMRTWEAAAREAGWTIFMDLPSRTEFRHSNSDADYVTDTKGEAAWRELCELAGITR